MRTKLVETNKPEKYIHTVRNAEASATIKAGTPVVLNLSTAAQPTTYQNGLPAGFEDGLQVVLPSTGGAVAAQCFYYGVACADILAGQLGEVTVFGVVASAIITRATRAGTSTSNSWSSSDSIAGSVALAIDTANNAFKTGASATGVGFSPGNLAILLDSVSSITASATATSDTRTAITTSARVFVRMM